MNICDRIRGGLYGAAVGDALGATLEFMGKEIVKQRYGVLTDIIGGGWLRLAPGEWTDDTEMMLAVAEGILQAPQDPVHAIGDGFLRWHKTNPPDVGTTIAAVFQKVGMGESWHEAAHNLHCQTAHTAGNGALMRTLPIGLAYSRQKDIMAQAQAIARMTHWDERAAFTCQLCCLLAYYFIVGKSFAEGLNLARLDLTKYWADNEDFLEMWTELEQKMDAPEPTGYTVDTLACALTALQSSGTLEEAVVSAVNEGGDADTVGAVTGGLAGVYYGFAAIPERWVKKFGSQQRERLDSAAESITNLRSQL